MARTKKGDHYKKGSVIPAEWIHADYLEFWLADFAKSMNCRKIINVCCGDSNFGTVRTDINPDSARTMEVDLFKIQDYFRPNSFELVYCDTDFKYFVTGSNRFNWQFELLKIASRFLITRRPRVNINMPSKHHDYVICEDSRPSLSVLRIDYK